MNYYNRYPGDYAKDTQDLSLVEHGAYTLLLDHLYGTQRVLPKNPVGLFRITRAFTQEEQEAVMSVIKRFFVATDEGYTNKRFEEEIKVLHTRKEKFWAKRLTKHQRAAMQATRRALKLKATPKWLTKQQQSQITAIYAEAAIKTASTGFAHQVDHIVPLRSKIVCGLHVPWNLQILTAKNNREKSNFFEVA